MDAHELQEQTEHAQHHGDKVVGLTLAVTAVFLSAATMLSHRAHTEEGTLQTKTNDAWGFYQAKHTRAYDFGARAENDLLANYPKEYALKNLRISIEEECGVPQEEHCTSPFIKDSPVLQQLAKEMKETKSTKETAESGEKGKEPGDSGGSKNPAVSTGDEKLQAQAKSEKAEKAEKKPKGTKEGAAKLQEKARDLEKEDEQIKTRADRYDLAELFLDISIVLCSVTLLSNNKLYWKISFITSMAGVVLALWGFLS